MDSALLPSPVVLPHDLAAAPVGFLSQPRRAHLVGCLGAGMRVLADVLRQAGWQITGSDANQQTEQSECDDAEMIIASLAIEADHPELIVAVQRGIPVLRYPQALGLISADYRTLGIAGTHGKSTTAAMLTQILSAASHEPTNIFGAEPLGYYGGGRLGRGEWFVVEACEYRQSFLQLNVEAAAILNIEHDHFDCFATFDSVVKSFARFARSVPRQGLLLIPSGCRASSIAATTCQARVETFGFDSPADWSAQAVSHDRGFYAFDITHHDRRLGRITLGIPGRHNVVNALAAAALATYAGCDWQPIVDGLQRFAGLYRRLEIVRDDDGLALVDDYAHHPTEIGASLDAIRQRWPGRRLWCVFQPHQVSRTRYLLGGLASSLRNADKVIVAKIFRAREPAAKPGDISAADLARCLEDSGGDAVFIPDQQSILEYLQQNLRSGDVVVTMGAGDIGNIAHGIGKWL